MSTTTTSNPFLAWTAGGPPPIDFCRVKFEDAVKGTGRDVLRGMRELERSPSWEALMAWLLDSQKLVALLSLVENSVRPRTPSVEAANRTAYSWVASLDRRESRFTKGAVRRKVLAWRNEPGRSQDERDLIDFLLTQWKQTNAFPWKLHSERLMKYMERMEKKRAGRAVWLGEKDVSELPDGIQRVARAQARSFRGGAYAGILRAGQPGFDEALANFSRESTRRRMWKAQQATLPSRKAVQALLAARQREARALGCQSHTQDIMMRHAMRAARTVKSALTTFGDALAGVVMRTTDKAETRAQDRWGISAAPWNTAFIEERAPLRAGLLLPQENHVLFPEAETLLRVGRDVLGTRGWRIGQRERNRAGVRYWTLHHATGRKAHLILDTSSQAAAALHNEGASVICVQGAWNNTQGEQAPTFLLRIERSYSRRGFTWDEVAMLAHELGHVLHGLAQPAAPLAWHRMPNDLSELPSQLVELLAYCPTVLKRWVSPKAKARYRTVAYWQERMDFHAENPTREQADTVRFLVDFMAHSGEPDLDLMASAQALQRRFGLPAFHDERTPFSYPSWGDYGGASYTYLITRFLIARMMPKWKAGAPSEEALMATIPALFEHVLERAINGKAMANAWRAWRKEPLTLSTRLGAGHLARRLARHEA